MYVQDEIALLSDTNFPELIIQYPDLGIESYLVIIYSVVLEGINKNCSVSPLLLD